MKKAIFPIALLCIGSEVISLAVLAVLGFCGLFLLIKAAAELR